MIEDQLIGFGFYSSIFFIFFLSLVVANYFFYALPNPRAENILFWASSCLLIIFCALRPLGIGRDDAVYIGISSGRCAYFECFNLIQSSRDWMWHSLISILNSFISSERTPMILSAFATAIQLIIISRLCRHKLLALTLFIPLAFITFDISLLRAGLTLSIYFIGIYLLATSSKTIGSAVLLGNYLFHSQGIFSIGVLPFSFLAKYKNFCLAIIFFLLGCIYLQLTPQADQLSFLAKGASATYWIQYKEGVFDNQRIFPLGSLTILVYLSCILIWNLNSLMNLNIERLALGSILLAVILAWFFAPIHAIQTRLFDFYVSPLIFLVGNLRLNRWVLVTTLGLALMLYARVEFIHNWILG